MSILDFMRQTNLFPSTFNLIVYFFFAVQPQSYQKTLMDPNTVFLEVLNPKLIIPLKSTS